MAKIPGPYLASITDWVLVWKVHTGDRHLDHLNEHQTYGGVVRIGTNTLAFNTIDAVDKIYDDRKANVEKTQFYRLVEIPAGTPSTHGLTDKAQHRRRRGIIDNGFTPDALHSAAVWIDSCVSDLVECVATSCKGGKDGWSPPQNMSELSTYLNYDIMGRLVFGEEFDCRPGAKHEAVPALLVNASRSLITVRLALSCRSSSPRADGLSYPTS